MDICIVNEFKQTDVINWEPIQKAKTEILITKNISIEYLRFPGFVAENRDRARKYINDVYSKILDAPIPPRGNISNHCKAAIVGIKPGMFLAKYSNNESAWLFGPSSKMLNDMLYVSDVYPYLTNVFHYREADINDTSKLDQIYRELLYLYDTNNDIKIIFLGKYDIFNIIINEFCIPNKIKFGQIWHPSYLCRSFTKEKFKEWVNSFKKFVI